MTSAFVASLILLGLATIASLKMAEHAGAERDQVRVKVRTSAGRGRRR